MAIQNTDIIDFISINLNGEVILTIADELDWDERNEHLLMLQDKINHYLAFVEDGKIYEQYPAAMGRSIFIEIASRYPPNNTAGKFIELVRSKLINEGYGFAFRVLKEGE